MKTSQLEWDNRFMNLAKHVAGWSKDPKQVGAVIVNELHRIVSTGYNGLPENIKDDPTILNDKEKKRQLVIHAEVNALDNMPYRAGHSFCLYVSRFPCSDCADRILRAGIRRIVAAHPDTKHPYWGEDLANSQAMLIHRGAKLVLLP